MLNIIMNEPRVCGD